MVMNLVQWMKRGHNEKLEPARFQKEKDLITLRLSAKARMVM